MDAPTTKSMQIGEWRVDPRSGEISRAGDTVRLEARTMRLLLHLADHVGEVVSIDDLLTHVWAGVIVTSDSVYQAVAALRRTLGDDAKRPSYIETVPRLGYRMVAAVQPWSPDSAPASLVGAAKPSPRSEPAVPRTGRGTITRRLAWGAGALGVLVLAFAVWVQRLSQQAQTPTIAAAAAPVFSIAVLPFLDLTDAMDEEPFADGMTEELIDRLSRNQAFRVPSLRSALYFKDKQLPIAAIADSLKVTYVVDGTVRKSGKKVRIAARLVRADNGYVAWSGTYDRPFDDILSIQDDIAGEVTKALTASIKADR